MNGSEIINPDTIKIFSALDGKARFVGGCVRNFLLQTDVTDIDIATQYKPEDTIKKLEQLGIRAIPTGIKHGTITALLNGKSYEITTLRHDISCDGRHANVEFTDNWEEDAARRDFTFNAMSMDLDGKIYDYFGGREDLKNGIVRFVGNAKLRVSEDILRVLRFFRFFAYYGKDPLNKEGIDACSSLADKIPTLSGERIQAEMFKLLAANKAGEVINLMNENKINNYLFQEDINIKSLHKMQTISGCVLLRLCSLMADFSIHDVKSQAKKWKLSNKDKNYLLGVLFPKVKVDFKASVEGQRKFIRLLGKDVYKDIILLKWSLGDLDTCLKDLLINDAEKWTIPVFPINGNDLKEFGIVEGKQVGELLSKAEDWWENEGYKPSKEGVLSYISKNHRL